MINKEMIRTVVRTKRFAVLLASVLSAATGSVAGYLVASKRLEKKYAEIAEQEIHEAKTYYRQQNKAGEFSDPSVLAEKYEDEDPSKMSAEDEELMNELKAALLEVGYTSDDQAVPVTPEEKLDVEISITKNVFDSEEDPNEFVLDDELDKKAKGEPYILEEDEYLENDSGYSQTALTYYAGDDILADERDHVIDNVKRAIGEDNLRFGYGSRSDTMVYIRNDKLNAEYEIALSTGKYSVEVAGFIEHSEKRGLRKFRDDD